MAAFSPNEVAFLESMSELSYGNPFLPSRIEAERAVLGDAFVPVQDVWSIRPEHDAEPSNVGRIGAVCEGMLPRLRDRLAATKSATARERELYRDLAIYVVYYRHHDHFYDLVRLSNDGGDGSAAPFFTAFVRDLVHVLEPVHMQQELSDAEVVHLFACFYQVRRAFSHIFHFIIGGSMATARLRAAIWQSVFTHDMRRYRRSLHDRMRGLSVLITGPSGTGKELVARAIAMSSYIPFEPNTMRFTAEPRDQFIALNPSALSPALIESELFGHRKGAYTGALSDHQGWMERAGPYGTVFLDEIGELATDIQVKLLRVLETGVFQRLGDTEPRRFRGKFAAATNRDLAQEIEQGRFRRDLYYRICSDIIRTPPLREQVAEDPAELRGLVDFLSRRLVGDEEAAPLTDEVIAWISTNLKPEYAWPGNVRELDQCIRNILVRKSYTPSREGHAESFIADFAAGSLTAEQVLSRYCTVVYALTGNYQETARRLQLDHRTVKAKIDPDLLDRLAK